MGLQQSHIRDVMSDRRTADQAVDADGSVALAMVVAGLGNIAIYIIYHDIIWFQRKRHRKGICNLLK